MDEMRQLIEYNGGELDQHRLHPTLRKILANFRPHVDFLCGQAARLHLNNIRVNFHIVRSLNFNALAALGTQEYHIIFTPGMFFRIVDIFLRMLANPKIFPGIGDVSKDVVDAKFMLPPKVLTNHTNVEEKLTHIFFQHLPSDQYRMEFALQLAHSALIFVLQHELCHITEGHLDYCFNATGQAMFLEAGFHKRSHSNDEKLVLEFSADMAAGHMGTFYFMNIYAEYLRHSSSDGYLGSAGRDELLHSWGFAVDTVFRLIEAFSSGDESGERTHPDPDTRYQAFTASAVRYFETADSPLSQDEMSAFAFGSRSGLIAWTTCGWPVSSKDRFGSSGLGGAHLDVLNGIIADVRRQGPLGRAMRSTDIVRL